MSLHQPVNQAPVAASRLAGRRERWIAIAGNPNTGKTALFNAITGLRQKVGNYPGVTVERKIGTVVLPGGTAAKCVDLPGCYSLVARGQDEQIAHDVLVGQVDDLPEPEAVILVADASNLQRNLYLASQIQEMGTPCVLALNMMDVAEAEGLTIDLPALSRALGIPVIPTVATREKGVTELLTAVEATLAPEAPAPSRERPWRLEAPLEEAVADLAGELALHGIPQDRTEAEAIWLLASLREDDELVGINPHIRAQVLARKRALDDAGLPFRPHEIQARYRWIEAVTSRAVHQGTRTRPDWTKRLDAIFTHRIAGPAIFLLAMTFIFQSIFAWADPAIGAIESLFAWISGAVEASLPAGPFRDLLTQGVIAGAGNVVVFLPQILLLFFAISLLEDTGYMARAAYMMDRVMGRVGLHGRAFIPLLSSFACAIPGVMAARTIESRKDRLVTILVAPLMSCSARLPVYTLVIAALFTANRPVLGVFTVGGLVLLAMYLLSIIAAIGVAAVFKRTLFKGPKPPLILEMPPYRLPRLSSVGRNLWERSVLFLTRAGTTIMAVTIVLWALLSYPKDVALSKDYASLRAAATTEEQLRDLDAQEASEHLQKSYAGRLGHAIEPAIAPLGFDWKIGIGLIGSFAAREVLVSTLGVVYGVGDAADEESAPLRQKLREETRADGTRVYTPLVGISLMVYFVLACQCMSTLAVVRRETNSWRWPAFLFAYMTVLAWVGSFLVYQGGRLLGFA